MKRILLTITTIISTLCTLAQHAPRTITMQPRIGIIAADLYDTKDTKIRAGLIIGADIEYYASKTFSLSYGICYSQQGAKIKTMPSDVDLDMKLDYISMPILANFHVLRGLALKAGIQPGRNIKSRVSGNIGRYNESVKLNNDVKNIDLAIPVGVSYEYMNFVIDARYNIGVTKVFEWDIYKSKNMSLQLTLGYKFDL